MSMIEQAGTYIAKATSWGVEVEEGKCPKFVMFFEVSADKDGQPVEGSITGYFTLINKDNSANEINLRCLKDVLGWDGQSFDTLNDGDWSQTEVQIVVEQEEYQGKTQLRVRYLNPKDYAGGSGFIKKAEPAAVQNLNAKYGSTLRALFGGKAKTGSNGASAPAVKVASADIEKGLAWKALTDRSPTYSQDRRKEAFKSCALDKFPGKEPRDLGAEEWKEVRQAIEADFSEAVGGLIPI